jgi:molybdopterin molybdotransferase
MLLCALGISQLAVFEKIQLVVATSGEEVSDDYTKALRHGEIYNSNAPLLLNMSNAPCFASRYYGILRDNRQTLIDFIAQSPEQILITTGAVSKGKWDFIPETLRELGAEIIFHSVAIRPGKPILFARLKDGRYFFGLPGNPVSAMVGWRFFVIPFLRKMLAKDREAMLELKLSATFKKKHSLRQFLKASLHISGGVAEVEISSEQESFKIKALSENALWAIVGEEQHSLASGELILALPRYADFS